MSETTSTTAGHGTAAAVGTGSGLPGEDTGVGAGAEPWCTRLAADLAVAAGIADELLTPRLQADMLRLARDVAHATERRNAPVAAFVLGRYVQARAGQGIAAEVAVTEAARLVARLLPADPGATP